MQARAALILVLLMSASPVASAQVAVEFHAPAQARGVVGVEGEWALLVFEEPDAASFDVDVEASRAWNHTHDYVVARSDAPGQSWHQETPVESREVEASAFRARLSSAEGRWGSLFVVADEVRLVVAGEAELHAESARHGAGRHLDGVEPFSHRESLAASGGAVAAWGAGSFSVRAEGVRVVEWHEFGVDCQAGPCPDGGAGTYEHRGAGPASLRVEQRHYVEVHAGGGDLQGSGTLIAAAAGASNGSVEGMLRLPLARAGGEAAGTLSLEGQVLLGDLRVAGDGLAASVSGNYTGAWLDESAVPPGDWGGWSPATAAGAGLGLLAALWWLRHLWLGRVRSPEQALRHPNRRRLMELVQENPGCTLNELARLAGHARSTVQHHVKVLERVGCVVRHEWGDSHHLYENHGRYGEADRVARALWRDERVRALDYWLSRSGPAVQRDCVAYARQRFGLPRSTARDCLGRLVAAGRARTWRQDGLRWYEIPETPGSTLQPS